MSNACTFLKSSPFQGYITSYKATQCVLSAYPVWPREAYCSWWQPVDLLEQDKEQEPALSVDGTDGENG